MLFIRLTRFIHFIEKKINLIGLRFTRNFLMGKNSGKKRGWPLHAFKYSVNFCSDLGVHEDLSAASSAWSHKDLNTACVVSGIGIQYCNSFCGV